MLSETLTKKSRNVDNFCRLLFVVVVAALGVEFVELPLGLSVYKVVIVPVCTMGSALILLRGVRVSGVWGLLPLLIFVPLMVLSYLKWGVKSSLVSAVGFLPFFIFMYFYIVNFGWPKSASWVLSLWSLPHFGSLILFHMGVSNEAFSDSFYRFDGIHNDPNFMALFVLASMTGKALLFPITRSLWLKGLMVGVICTEIFMIGMSGSRGGAIGMTLSFLVFLLMQIGFRRALLVFLSLGIMLNTLFALFYSRLPLQIALSPFWLTIDRIIYSDDFADLNSSSSGRLYLWANALEIISEKGGMIGYTIENFRNRYYLFPHNSFLDAALECGFPGMLLLVGLVAFSVIVLVRYIKFLDDGGRQSLMLGAACWGTLLFLSSFTTKVFWFSIIIPYATSVRLVQHSYSRRSSVDNDE